MNCTTCGISLADGLKFCTSCGTKVEPVMLCTSCGKVLKPNTKFCGGCGTAVAAPVTVSSVDQPVVAPAVQTEQPAVASVVVPSPEEDLIQESASDTEKAITEVTNDRDSSLLQSICQVKVTTPSGVFSFEVPASSIKQGEYIVELWDKENCRLSIDLFQQ